LIRQDRSHATQVWARARIPED